MLTGKPPFSGGDLNSILKQVLSEPTPPPSSHNPTLPRAFDHIVGKALAKDPKDRYQTADEMAHDLRHFDSFEFETPAPSLLPALEHPTTPFQVPQATVPHDELLLPPEPEGVPIVVPWWRRPQPLMAAIGSAIALVVVAIVLVTREPAVTAPVMTEGPRPASTRTIAAAPEIVPAVTAPPTVDKAAPPPAKAAAPMPSEKAAAPMPSEKAAAATPPVAPKPTGRVAFAVTPWGEIVVDGRKRGVSPPMQELQLAPGRHVIEIRNTTFPAYRETVEVAADGVLRIKHKFP
jgi:serine/threonine-protein kinase